MSATFAELMKAAQEGFVTYAELFPRYIALLGTGMNEEDAFYLAYRRALEYAQAAGTNGGEDDGEATV